MRWLAFTIIAFASSARADELDDLYVEANHITRPTPRPLDHDQIWYGWQTLSADATFITAFALYPKWSGFKGDGVLLFVDVLGYWTVSPLIDALHGNVTDTSIAIRLALPLAGSLLGLGIGTAVPTQCTSFLSLCTSPALVDGAFYGALFGAGLASLIDSIAFTWKTRKPKPDTTSWTLTPIGVRGGGGIGAMRAF
jgi:hypothetical protein